MAALGYFAPIACDGCFVGFPAVLSLVIAVVVLVGSIYILLASNLGTRLGYLVLMVSLGIWMIILSSLWLFGAPGTTTATGPRGREPAWIPFTPTSQIAQEDFAEQVALFPGGWDAVGGTYPGKIASGGEFENVRSVVETSLARLGAAQGTKAKTPQDWAFRAQGVPPASPDQSALPAAKVRYLQSGNTLLFGAVIPATDTHPQTTVFAYRNKGLVFLYAAYFLIVSVIVFAAHLWLLARFERAQKREEAEGHPAFA
ncbi:MAG: hypothetical protein WDA27_12915 [Actinomycetota bacterium]